MTITHSYHVSIRVGNNWLRCPLIDLGDATKSERYALRYAHLLRLLTGKPVRVWKETVRVEHNIELVSA